MARPGRYPPPVRPVRGTVAPKAPGEGPAFPRIQCVRRDHDPTRCAGRPSGRSPRAGSPPFGGRWRKKLGYRQPAATAIGTFGLVHGGVGQARHVHASYMTLSAQAKSLPIVGRLRSFSRRKKMISMRRIRGGNPQSRSRTSARTEMGKGRTRHDNQVDALTQGLARGRSVHLEPQGEV